MSDEDCEVNAECEERFDSIDKSLTSIKKSITGFGKVVKTFNGKLTKHGAQLSEVERKVFNGFGDKITNLDKRVEEVRGDIKNTRNLMFTMLILIVVGFVGSSLLQNRSVNTTQARIIETVQEVQDETDNTTVK